MTTTSVITIDHISDDRNNDDHYNDSHCKNNKTQKKYVGMFNFTIFTIYLFMNRLLLDFYNLIIDDFAEFEFLSLN